MKNLLFEICPICGNLVEKVEDHRVPLMCCGQKLNRLVPNSTEAAVEKHQPVIRQEGEVLIIEVGEVTRLNSKRRWYRLFYFL